MAKGDSYMTTDLIHNLSGIDLEFAFAKACGFEMIGKSSGPFAVGTKNGGGLLIFGADEESVSQASFSTSCSYLVLSQGQKLQAKLISQGALVACKIGEVEASGEDYTQAMMRAIVLYSRRNG